MSIKWPHAAYYEAVGAPVTGSVMKEKDKVWLVEYEKCHRALRDRESEIYALKQDNQRLKHENEFMLRLINERTESEQPAPPAEPTP